MSRARVAILACVALVSFIAFLYASNYDAAGKGEDANEPTSFSYRAVGVRAAVEVLRDVGWDVDIRRFPATGKADPDALHVFVEPLSNWDDRAGSAIEKSGRCLVVLPKWEPDPADPGRDGPAFVLRPDFVVERTLALVGCPGTIKRLEPAAPVNWTRHLGARPSIPHLQLVQGGGFLPLISTDQGALLKVSHLGGRTVYLLSDPDLISNHGLGIPGNAAALASVFREAAPPGGRIVFDEVIHGYELRPSLWRSLSRPPLGLATLQAVLATLALVWAGAIRFGRPVPLPPPFERGKLRLIETTAQLQHQAGRPAEALRRYMRAVEREVSDTLRPPGGEPEERRKWLDNLARRRGSHETPSELRKHVARLLARPRPSTESLLRVARRIHRWRREMLHGS